MKQSIDIRAFQSAIGTFFRRFHTTLFFVIVGTGLIISMFMLVTILGISNTTDDSQVKRVDQSFDEATIKNLDELDQNDNSDSFTLPSGRTNPFVE